jgi:hypothetical protein
MRKKWVFVLMGILCIFQTLVAQEIFPRVGHWKVTGRDNFTIWTNSSMIIEEVDGNAFKGYFDWYSIMNSEGREYFIGAYDPKYKKVELRGYRLSNNSKGLALGVYEAYLSRNGYDFEDGKWGGFFANPGTWEAEWQR